MIRFGPLLQLSPPEQAHSYCWGWFDLVFKSLLGFFVRFFFWPCHAACGILDPVLGIEPLPFAVKAWSHNH